MGIMADRTRKGGRSKRSAQTVLSSKSEACLIRLELD